MVQPATGAFTAEVCTARPHILSLPETVNLLVWPPRRCCKRNDFGCVHGCVILQVTPPDKRGQAEGIRRQASDIISLGAPIGLGFFADLLSAPGAIGFSAIAMAGTCTCCVFLSDAFSLHACERSWLTCTCRARWIQMVSSTARQLGFQRQRRAMQTAPRISKTPNPKQLRSLSCSVVVAGGVRVD